MTGITKHWWVPVALLLLLPSLSASHGMLLRSLPAADSEITRLPETIRLSFSERVESRFSRVTVHRAQVDSATGELTPGDRIDDDMAEAPAITQEPNAVWMLCSRHTALPAPSAVHRQVVSPGWSVRNGSPGPTPGVVRSRSIAAARWRA